jgi:hypothetical protein
MKYILDSNIALKWVLAEPDSSAANQLHSDFNTVFTICLLRMSFRSKLPTH